MSYTPQIIANLAVPLAAGGVFFLLAAYVRKVAPMRTLVTGSLTYRAAFWGFVLFGGYLATRPLQILLGPHPAPLIVNNIREFFLIGLFGPAVFVAMMSLCFGADQISRGFIKTIFGLCVLLAGGFCAANVRAIGGSEIIFWLGGLPAYDGIWFDKGLATPLSAVASARHGLLGVLFTIRLFDPVILLCIAGGIVLWRGATFPRDSIYNNMARKLYLLSAAVFSFALSMFFAGIMILFLNVPNQWWLYYAGALLAGLLELASLILPVSRVERVSDHE